MSLPLIEIMNITESVPLGIFVCLLFGICIGLINGYLSIYLGISSLIVTLGMLFILRGAVYLYTGQRAIPDELMSDFFFYIGNGKFMGTVPYAAMIGLTVLIIFIYVMHNTSYGRKLYAIGGNQEVDFQISVRATPYMVMQSRTLSVSATVQEINSLPPANTASSQNNMIVNIMQYSLVQVEAVEPFVQLMPKKDKNFGFKVYNLGNQIDFMKVGITDSSRTDLEKAGFTINLPAVKVQIDAIPTATKVRVMARTPKTQGWSDAYHVLDFYAESEFACNNGGCIRESQMITVYVRGVYLPGFEVVPAVSMLALAAAVAGRRMTGSEDEEGEWRESAPGL